VFFWQLQYVNPTKLPGGMPVTMSNRRKWIFRIVAVTGALLASVLVCELSTRALGFRPLEAAPLDIQIMPGSRYQTWDKELGFRPIPGHYTIVFDHRWTWELTNLPDTTRITRPLESYDHAEPKPGVWVFGCSFVQGWGLNDNETFPWKLQMLLPDYDVVNFGVGGYGTLQSLLELRRAFAERPLPRIVMLAYADFHDARNTRLNSWREATYSYDRFGSNAQPFARLDGPDHLQLFYDDGSFRFLALRHRSAFCNLVASRLGSRQDATIDSRRVSELLLTQFAEECHKHGVNFLLAGIWPSELTHTMLERMSRRGLATVDISADPRDPANGIPYDGHPSAVATRHFAETVLAELNRLGYLALPSH